MCMVLNKLLMFKVASFNEYMLPLQNTDFDFRDRLSSYVQKTEVNKVQVMSAQNYHQLWRTQDYADFGKFSGNVHSKI